MKNWQASNKCSFKIFYCADGLRNTMCIFAMAKSPEPGSESMKNQGNLSLVTTQLIIQAITFL